MKIITEQNSVVENMMDAFLALKDIDDEDVDVSSMVRAKQDLTEARLYSVNASQPELEEASEFLNKHDEETSLEVIDVDADSVNHLKNKESYIGQAILQCRRCKAKSFISMDDLVADDEDNPEIYNVETECPNCKEAGAGFDLIGQVGKMPSEEEEAADENPSDDLVDQEPAEGVLEPTEEPVDVESDLPDQEEATLENDFKSDAEDASLENDLEPDENNNKPFISDEDSSEEPSDLETETEGKEIPHKHFRMNDEDDIDPDQLPDLDTYTSEDDDLPDSDELPDLGKIFKKKVKKDDDEDMEESYIPFAVDFSLNEDLNGRNDLWQQAWMMNQVISCMNDEEAYYGAWLYYWPDECSKDECREYFNDPESFQELKGVFERTYKAYHYAGLFEAPENVLAYARQYDNILGLKDIKNVESKKNVVKEDAEEEDTDEEEVIFVDDLLDCFVDPENIEKWEIVKEVITHDEDKEPEITYETVYEGDFDELPEELGDAEFVSFDVGVSRLTVDIDKEPNEEEGSVADVLAFFGNDDTDKISLVDVKTSQEVFEGTKEEVIEKFGDCEFVAIETPEYIRIVIASEDPDRDEIVKNNNKPFSSDLEKGKEDVDESLENQIFKANGMAAYRLNNANSNEYWIHESLSSGDDIEYIYEHFVKGKGRALEQLFKKETGYREVVVEQLDEEVAEAANKESDSEPVEESAAEEPVNESMYDQLVAYLGRKPEAEVAADAEEPITEAMLHESELDKFHKYLDSVAAEDAEPTVESFKDRKELGEAIERYKKENKQFTIRKSLTEGYRYDLVTEGIRYMPGSGKKLLEITSDATGEDLAGDTTPEEAVEAGVIFELKNSYPTKVTSSEEIIRNGWLDIDTQKRLCYTTEKGIKDFFGEYRVMRCDADNLADMFEDMITHGRANELGLTQVTPQLAELEAKITDSTEAAKAKSAATEEEDLECPNGDCKDDKEIINEKEPINEDMVTYNQVYAQLRRRLYEICTIIQRKIREKWGYNFSIDSIINDIVSDVSMYLGEYERRYWRRPDNFDAARTIAERPAIGANALSTDNTFFENEEAEQLAKIYAAITDPRSPMFMDEALIDMRVNQPQFGRGLNTPACPYVIANGIETAADFDRQLADQLQNRLGIEDRHLDEEVDDSDDEIDLDLEMFDEDVNNYFNENYENTLVYKTLNASVDPKTGVIIAEGVVRGENKSKDIKFTLTPDKSVNENYEAELTKDLKKTLGLATYTVENDLSKEKFTFKFVNDTPNEDIFSRNGIVAEEVFKSFKKEFKASEEMFDNAEGYIHAVAEWEFHRHNDLYKPLGMDVCHVERFLLANRD